MPTYVCKRSFGDCDYGGECSLAYNSNATIGKQVGEKLRTGCPAHTSHHVPVAEHTRRGARAHTPSTDYYPELGLNYDTPRRQQGQTI